MGSVSPPKSSTPFIKLLSKDHEEILNVIDHLRSEGISNHVELPQLIVCGDQSVGKSSVLEAISGLNFPRKENLCTRFATELILRRAATTSVTVSIRPDYSRSPDERERLRSFKPPNPDLEHFASIIESAGDFIGVGRDGQVFSKDVLRVEFQSPEQPHLTLVDLPGLYVAPDENQDQAGVAFVESLVLSYMHNSRSVILAVVSAKSLLVSQRVISLAREVDPHGTRTLGIITQPDTLSKGSDQEASFFQLAMNNRGLHRLSLGWHVLKNRSYEERDMKLEERSLSEREFLSKGIWTQLPRHQAGIDSLRPRLSTVLRDHILSSLPDLVGEAQRSLRDSRENLKRLGQARQTLAHQRQYLFQSSERFSSLLSGAVNGVYSDGYFGDAMADNGHEKRLRAMVQSRLSDFSETMCLHGQSRTIVDDDKATEDNEHEIRWSSYIHEVRQRLRRSKRRELPGTFNPLIIGELFYAHSEPWERIATSFIERLLADVRRAVTLILEATVDEKSFDGLVRHVINPTFDKMEESLRSKTDELLRPQQKGHPITYNQSFTARVQAARATHLQKVMERKLRKHFKMAEDDRGGMQKINISKLASALATETETDWEILACSEATACMQAYYEIAQKKFVDDFSNLAVEKCLLEPVLTIFSSEVVNSLQDSIVEEIAAEDESSRVERRRLEEKITVLQSSLHEMHRLDRHQLAVGKSNTKEQHSSMSLIGFNDNATSNISTPADDDETDDETSEEE